MGNNGNIGKREDKKRNTGAELELCKVFNVKLYLLKDINCQTFISIGDLWRLI